MLPVKVDDGPLLPRRELLFTLMVGSVLALESGRAILEELFQPTVEYRWLQSILLTQIRNRHFIQQVRPEDGTFSSPV
jgi:hypothetical protein